MVIENQTENQPYLTAPHSNQLPLSDYVNLSEWYYSAQSTEWQYLVVNCITS